MEGQRESVGETGGEVNRYMYPPHYVYVYMYIYPSLYMYTTYAHIPYMRIYIPPHYIGIHLIYLCIPRLTSLDPTRMYLALTKPDAGGIPYVDNPSPYVGGMA